MTYEALVWAWALALILLTCAVTATMGWLTARLVNHALGQVKKLTAEGAGPPPPHH